ncbi:UDP-N-acetyl glucosamine 2-epimerase [Deinococcus aerolatus]|uniref:UDP-N-acetyl glucosamine 2-epimerase n=1 Tax=Deinococcus aerolatus TaxID=522487 RepID=A0ABQ2GES5_9DEIO|nr:UDP-N-acetylglucosamine 2-epimerase (non-hydrolyzing) [Deinococcus aerolatus]GGL90121.1 UDP-N-acetyl glucosamine 2-epimerase [Deinococcus aerolatus]
MKVVTVIGARPQFIKAAAVSRVLRSEARVSEVLVHTGQHYDENMSTVFFDQLGIPAPERHLNIGSGTHGLQTGRMLEAVEQVLLQEQPDWLLVYGDTNSTLAGALAAAKLHVPVAHVEAGLRSFNRRMPEEINRVLTDHASDVLFAPTSVAVENLRREGIADERIVQVGDVMYDAALYFGNKAELESRVLETLDLRPGAYVLATVHRAENTDALERLHAIVDGLIAVAADMPVVLPLHPRTRGVLERAGMLERASQCMYLIPPVGYLDMIKLEKNACLIATDSGGVQKEAYFYGVPCVTFRDETEWVELVETGWNRLVAPVSAHKIRDAILSQRGTQGADLQLYGEGDAGRRITNALMEWK